MEIVVLFFKNFISSPTAIITLISVIIATLVYEYQRNEKKKDKAFQIAKQYATDIIPTGRFINQVLSSIEATQYTKVFAEKMKTFDNAELCSLLNEQSLDIQGYYRLFEKINSDIIQLCMVKSGININIKICYTTIEEQDETTKKELYAIFFKKFVMDFLNNLESLAMLLKYNLADEKIIYQSLHQTFLAYMSNLYYFIAEENYLNDSRYYENIIWLYRLWKKRECKQRKKELKKRVGFKGKKL